MLVSSLLLPRDDRVQEEHDDVHQYDQKREQPYFAHVSGVAMKSRVAPSSVATSSLR
jgi:hypothetical protein